MFANNHGMCEQSSFPKSVLNLVKFGPSAGKLHANDQILKINDEDVHDLPQADVILRIK